MLLVVGFGGWAATCSISGAVIASGTVAVEGKRKVIQHLEEASSPSFTCATATSSRAARCSSASRQTSRRELEGLEKEISARSAQIELIEGELKNLLELLGEAARRPQSRDGAAAGRPPASPAISRD